MNQTSLTRLKGLTGFGVAVSMLTTHWPPSCALLSAQSETLGEASEMRVAAGRQETSGLLGRATTTGLANIGLGPQASA